MTNSATVTMPLAELDLLRMEPEKVRTEMKKDLKDLQSIADKRLEENLDLIARRQEAEKKSQGITITVKERGANVFTTPGYSAYPFYSYISSPSEKEISSVTYKNMDEVLQSIKESLDLEQREELKKTTEKLGQHEEDLKKLKEQHAKEIRILRDELADTDTIEKLEKAESELKRIMTRGFFARLFNKPVDKTIHYNIW